MFCTRCGKKIDDDSTFCPYCGNRVGGDTPVSPVNSRTNAPVLPKTGLNKKIIFSSAVGLITILAVIGVVRLLSGGSKTSDVSNETAQESVKENIKENTNSESIRNNSEDVITTEKSTETTEPAEPEPEVIDIYSLDWKQLFCDEISSMTHLNKYDKVYYSITDINNDGIPELSYDVFAGGDSITMFLCSDSTYPVGFLMSARAYKNNRVYCSSHSDGTDYTLRLIYEWNEYTMDYDRLFFGIEELSTGYDKYGASYDDFKYTIDDKECSMEVWNDTLDALGWGEAKAYLLTPIRYENVVSGSEAIDFFTQLIRNW